MTNFSKKLLLILCGAAIGFVNGFFGGGGGMLCIPILIYVLNQPVKKAHATAMVIILPISIVSAFFYFNAGALSLPILLNAGTGIFAGGLLGSFILPKVSDKIIRFIFSTLMLIAGIKLLIGWRLKF